MKKTPLKERIENYLFEWSKIEPNKFIHAAEIEDLAKANGWLGSTATRELRRSVEEGIIIKKRDKNNKSLVYQFNLY